MRAKKKANGVTRLSRLFHSNSVLRFFRKNPLLRAGKKFKEHLTKLINNRRILPAYVFRFGTLFVCLIFVFAYVIHPTATTMAASLTRDTDTEFSQGTFSSTSTTGSGSEAKVQLSGATVAWTPSNLTTSLWLDADDAATITKDGSNLVSQWNDKSGNGRNATQATSANRPVHSNKTVVFNGTSQYMQTPITAAPNQNGSIIGVYNSTSTGGVYAGIINIDSTPGDNPEIRIANGDNSPTYWNGAYVVNVSTGGLTESVHSTKFVNPSGTTSVEYRRNGTVVASGSRSGTWSPINEFTLGRYNRVGQFRGGNIKELVVYNSSDTDRQKLEGYLAHKWGLTANLPADHPYKASAPTASTMASSGTWESATDSNAIDLTWNGGWGDGSGSSTAFSANISNVSATATITFAMRVASSQAGLSSAPYVTIGTANSGTTFTATKSQLDTLGIGTGTNRYVQVKATLAQTGGVTPQLDNFTLNYLADVAAPATNASGLAMKQSLSGSSVSSNAWTNGPHPYFSWTAGSDGDSGLAGYCLYLGQDNTADVTSTKGLLGTSPLSTNGKCQFAVSADTLDTAQANYLATALTSSNQPYYLLVKAIDNAGNVYGDTAASFQFKFDNTVPQNPDYVSAPSQLLSTKDVTITWPTSGTAAASDANSGLAGLQYRIGTNGTWYGVTHNGAQDLTDLLPNNGSYQTRPAFDYADMDENANNVFQFRTVDNAGNTSAAALSTVVKINTTAPSSPRNLVATPTTNTTNNFAFSWDAPTSYAGSASDITYCYSVNTAPNVNTCSFTAAGQTSLSAGAYATQPGENTIYVVAKDQAGNINYATAASTSFNANTSAPGIPLNIDVADISVKSTQNWKLAVSWEVPTDEGAGVANYKIYRALSENGSYSQVATTSGTSFVDTGLSAVTYYYKIRACDSANNCGAYSSITSKLPTGRYTSPADLIGAPSVSVSTRKATITWTTDRTSDSKVQFGTSSGKYFVTEAAISDQVKVHKVEVTGLEAGTTYYYKAKWTDEDGNTGTSSELSFTTLPAPTISDVKVIRTTLSSALIQFTSKDATKVNIYYGKTKGFGGLKAINTSLSESTYTFELEGLDDGDTYYFRADAVDIESYAYVGRIDSFTTPPRPRISNLRFQPIEGEPTSTQRVTWTTNVPSSSTVSYGLLNTAGSDIYDAKLTTEHAVTIKNLQDDSNYFLLAQSRDIDGNLAVSERQVFKTALDTRPPRIRDVTVETSIRGNGAEARGQVVVSWRTDEPSTRQVAYAEGSGVTTFNNRSNEDAVLATEHVVIISDLATSRVYTVQPISKDKAGNQTSGDSRSAIVGRPSDSVITIVLNTLRKVFGF